MNSESKNTYNSFFQLTYLRYEKLFKIICEEEYNVNEENCSNYFFHDTNLNPENVFQNIEKKMNKAIPFYFKCFYCCNYSIDYDFQIDTISLALPHREFLNSCLENMIYESDVIDEMFNQNLIPIGTIESVFICIKTDNSDEQVYLFNPELTESEKETTCIWFSSFDKFILCLCSYLKTGNTNSFNSIDTANRFHKPFSNWAKFNFQIMEPIK